MNTIVTVGLATLGAICHTATGAVGPHAGMATNFTRKGLVGSVMGFMELKLRDDKGGLELWVTEDRAMTKPHYLAMDKKLTVEFDNHDPIILMVRNDNENKDEDCVSTVDKTKKMTNYFIAPSGGGEAPAWLVGKPDFSDMVTITFQDKDKKWYSTPKFELTPHVHAGGGHSHGIGPNLGMVSKFYDEDNKDEHCSGGHLELKLHDDKGDLELWLAKDEHITTPFPVPMSQNIHVKFSDKGKKVTMKRRNSDENENEDGESTALDGDKTWYFIYPPEDSDIDVTWLQGKSFNDMVTVSFKLGKTTYTTDKFKLVPHTHGGEKDDDEAPLELILGIVISVTLYAFLVCGVYCLILNPSEEHM